MAEDFPRRYAYFTAAEVTFWPSASVDSPARSTAEMCTNTSLPPLDWQMWFAAYRSVAENAWFEGLTQQLLKGSPAVLALLSTNIALPTREHTYRPGNGGCVGWRLYFPRVSLADFWRGLPSAATRGDAARAALGSGA